MKNLFPVFASVAAATCFAFVVGTAYTPIEIGTSIPQPDHKMNNVMNDKSVSLNECKAEKGLLVIFSCNTCPFVVASQDRIRDVQRDAQRMHIGCVIINSNEDKRNGDDAPSAMKNYGNDQKFLAPYLVDSASYMADLFGASRTPECFLFDKDGKLVYRGSIDDSPKDAKAVKQHYLLDAMSAMSKGKPIAVQTTVSLGCSIKRVTAAPAQK